MRTDEQIQKKLFGDRARWLSDKLGIYAVDIAAQLGVSQGAVSNWFRLGEITIKNAVDLAELLGTTVEALWRGGGEFDAMDERSRRGSNVIDIEAREVQSAPPPDQPLTASAIEIAAAWDRLPTFGDKVRVWQIISNLQVKNPFAQLPAPATRPPVPSAPAPSAPVSRTKPKRPAARKK